MASPRPVPRTARTGTAIASLLAPLLLLLLLAAAPLPAVADVNHYCGTTWNTAAQSCERPCFSGNDGQCKIPGETCFGFTGCAAKLNQPTTGSPTLSPSGSPMSPTASPTTAAPTSSAAPTPTPPTDVPTGSPSASPFVRPMLQVVDAAGGSSGAAGGGGGGGGGGDGGGGTPPKVLSAASQRSYGIIFEVRTTEGAPVMGITGLEFYCPLRGAEVTYELWTKPGSWHGYEGQERRFRKVSGGNVTTATTAGELTRVPQRLGQRFEIPLDGDGSRHAVYLTLTTKHVLYARSGADPSDGVVTSIVQAGGPKEDTVVLASTPDLIVYEGAAVTAYPFSSATQRIYYRVPRGFVGRMWYHRFPCPDVLTTVASPNGTTYEEYRRVERWDQCRDRREPIPMPTTAGRMPSSFITGDDGGEGGSDGATPARSPTSSPMPTVDAMPIYLILTLENVAGERIMTLEERGAFQEAAIDFFVGRDLLDLNEIELYGARVRYQQLLRGDEDGGGGGGRGGGAGGRGGGRLRRNERRRAAANAFAKRYERRAQATGIQGFQVANPGAQPSNVGNAQAPIAADPQGPNPGGGAASATLGARPGVGQVSQETLAVPEENVVPPAEEAGAGAGPGGPSAETTESTETSGTSPAGGANAPPVIGIGNVAPEGAESGAGGAPEATGSAASGAEGAMDESGAADAKDEGTEGDDREATSLEVTLVVSVLYSPLPRRITQELLRTLLANEEPAFVLSLRTNPALAPLMGSVSGMPSVVASDVLTDPPTNRPTEAPTSAVDVEEGGGGLGGASLAAVAFLLLYAVLAAITGMYVKSARELFRKEQQDRLLGQELGDMAMGMEYEEVAKKKKMKERSMSLRKFGKMSRRWSGISSGDRSSEDEDEDEGGMENGNGNANGRRPLLAEEDGGHEDGEEEELSSMEDSYYSEEGSEEEEEKEEEEEEESEEEEEDSESGDSRRGFD